MGCRHTNPEICGNNGIARDCEFVSDDSVCKNHLGQGKI